jgi:hypothetical protein
MEADDARAWTARAARSVCVDLCSGPRAKPTEIGRPEFRRALDKES